MNKTVILKIILLNILFLPQLYSHENIKKVTLQLSWFSQFQFAGYYMAKEKGFYKDENIDVTIKPYDFQINVSKEVSEQKSHFGIGRENLILDKINNFKNIVALYPLFQVSPIVLLSKKHPNILSIKDFKNKRLMVTKNDIQRVAIKAMIHSSGISFDDIKFLEHTHDINDLTLNKTDIISAYVSKAPYVLEKQNISYNIFAPKDYGFAMYADFLFTSQELINEDLSLVKSFKRASLKGWRYAYNNIDESIELILKKYNTQNLTKEELLFEAKELKKLSYVQGSSLGEMDTSKVTRMLSLSKLVNNITENVNEDFSSFIFRENNIALTQREKKYLKTKKILTMCVQDDNMPYEKINDSSFEGIVAEYKKLLEEKINIKIATFITNSKEESQDYLIKGYCDFFSTESNIQGNNILSLSTPYIQLPYIIFSKQDHVFISNLKQLKNTKIITNQTQDLNAMINKSYPSINKVETNLFKEGFSQLKKDKVDFFITNIANASYFIKDHYAPNIYITGRLNEKQSFSFAILKEDKTLLNIINKILDKASKKEHDDILNGFTNFQYSHTIDYSFVIKVSLFFSVIIALLVYFYRSEIILKNKISKLNYSLEYKIKQEVQKNRQKDEYLFRQSKLASMGEMIRNIAHQWRQPLNRISLSSQVVENLIQENNINNNDLIQKKLSHINENIQYMSDTIEDFMYYFNPNKVKKVFYFYEAFQKTLELIKTRTKKTNINLNIKQTLKLAGYENEFKQIILVILNNALDNKEMNNIKDFAIDITVKDNENHFSILISDNGGGINENIIDKIFEPYFTTKFKKEGSGIGLYMVKVIVEQSMHGRIDVYSSNDVTNFLIELPKE